MSEERITRVTLEQARKMKSLTDWDRVRALTDEDIERAVAEDPDAAPFWTEEDWANARVIDPRNDAPVWLDKEIVAWFEQQGPGYESRINAVLRPFVDARKQQR